MRIPVALTALVLLVAPVAPMCSAQDAPAAPIAPAAPACDGVLSIVRVSEITPTGSIEKFKAAVAAHQAWYASHGYSDLIFAAPLLERDPQTDAMSYSASEMLTYHYIKPGNPPPAHDAAWDAYVKLYSETSTIKETYANCVPTADAPTLK